MDVTDALAPRGVSGRAWAWLVGHPLSVVFLTSLLISAVVLHGNTLNRDGMLYVEAAFAYQSGGFGAARAIYEWPFFSIVLASLSSASGLHPEICGLVLNALFMAGTCSLAVAVGREVYPHATWHIALITLALPGLNRVREELVRDHGAWFFMMLALWLALYWARRPSWPSMLYALGAVACGVLFRPEYLMLLPVLFFFGLYVCHKRRAVLAAAGLVLLMLVSFWVLVALFAPELRGMKLFIDILQFSLEPFSLRVAVLQQWVIQALGPVQARLVDSHVGTILLMGSLAIAPKMWLVNLNIVILPILLAIYRDPWLDLIRRNALFLLVFVVHGGVVSVFAINHQFLTPRYIGPLMWVSIPLAGHGLWLITRMGPLWARWSLLAFVLLAVSNCHVPGSKKLYFIEAGEWLKTRQVSRESVFLVSPRTSYYAGWGFSRQTPDLSMLPQVLAKGSYRYYVFEITRRNNATENLLVTHNLSVVRQFKDYRGDGVVIAAPQGGTHDP